MPGPDRSARCSVALPISAAVGMIPAAAMKKIRVGAAWAISRTTARGMNGTSRNGQPSGLVRNLRIGARPLPLIDGSP